MTAAAPIPVPPSSKDPKDYIATMVWHKRTGSYQYYINDMQQKAVEDQQPIDVLYQMHADDGTRPWVSVRDLPPDNWFHEVYAEALTQYNAYKAAKGKR